MSEQPGSRRKRPGVAWLGAHLFSDLDVYGAACDAMILEVVQPMVREFERRGWIDGFFFLRYGEGGPHVRLRLRGEPSRLMGQVKPAVRTTLRLQFPEMREGIPDQPIRSPSQGHPITVTHLAFIDYEPEFLRYGGVSAMPIGERMFEASSNCALSLLSQIEGNDRSSRLGRALLSMVVLMHAFEPSSVAAARLAQRHGTGYLATLVRDRKRREPWWDAFDAGFDRQSERLTAHVHAVWNCLAQGGSASDALDRLSTSASGVRDDLAELCRSGQISVRGNLAPDWSTVVDAIVPSYVHLMNNRLGIMLHEESYLAHLVCRSLAQIHEAAHP